MPSCHYLDFIYVHQQCPYRTCLFPARGKVWCRTVTKAGLLWLTLSVSRKMSLQWLLKLCSDKNCEDGTIFLSVKISPLHQRWWVELPNKCHNNLQLPFSNQTLTGWSKSSHNGKTEDLDYADGFALLLNLRSYTNPARNKLLALTPASIIVVIIIVVSQTRVGQSINMVINLIYIMLCPIIVWLIAIIKSSFLEILSACSAYREVIKERKNV